ncbi:MAG TPA: YceI family protein [Steroidobacteraceae bacterium]
MFKICLGACAAVLLAACGAPKIRTPGGGAAAPVHAPPAGVAAYHIDSAQSELRLLVHRAGPMARLGHNHVMVNRAVGGWVDAADAASGASFSLRVPVAEFVVDEAEARAEGGADFSEEIQEDARSGTRHNMLSAALLDADRYPIITLTSIAVAQAQAPGQLAATLAVEVAGHESTLVVPFTLETSAGRVSAFGTVALRQSELGLTPFSVMLGALQVQDEFTVKFKLVALKN